VNTSPPITQIDMSNGDIEQAQKIAEGLGFTRADYTYNSQFWGVYCTDEKQRSGFIIKTKEHGFLFVCRVSRGKQLTNQNS
jgi:hypothetical protein